MQRHHTDTQPVLTMPGRDCSAQPDKDKIKAALDSVLKSVPDGDALLESALDVADEVESEAIEAAQGEVMSEEEEAKRDDRDSSSGWESEPPLDLSDMEYCPSGVRNKMA